jgi:hypothetical protein
MILSKRAPLISRTALSVATLACVWLIMSATGLAAAAIHFQSESLTALEAQLGHHEVRALSFHSGPAGAATGHIHASLKDGQHMTVLYPTSEQAQLIALARTDSTRVTIAKAKAKAAKPAVHHKLRYIAGGILVVVIVVVVAVLLIDRRRKLGGGGVDRVAESAPAASSPPDPT